VTTTALADARLRHRNGIALAVLSTIAWSSAGLFVRLLPFDPWTIVFWRGVFGTAFIGTYVLWRFGLSTVTIVRRMGPMGGLITLCSTAGSYWLSRRSRAPALPTS